MRSAQRATAVLLGVLLAMPLVSAQDTALAAGRFTCSSPGTAAAGLSDLTVSPDTVHPSTPTAGLTVQLPAGSSRVSVAARDAGAEVVQSAARASVGNRWSATLDVPEDTPRGILGVEVRWYDAGGTFHLAAPCDLEAASLPFQLFVDPVRPSAPASVSGIPADGSVAVRWVAGDDGSSPFTAWTVTADPGGRTLVVPGDARSAVVDGLRNGSAYTFRVSGSNRQGSGPETTSTELVPRRPAVLTSLRALTSPVVHGAASSVNGQLTTPTGQPLGDRAVELIGQTAGSTTWQVLASGRTDGNGRLALRAVLQRSSALRLHHPPDDLAAPDAGLGTVSVASRVSAAASRTRTAVRSAIAVRGALAPARAGAVVTLQGWTGRSWASLASARASATSGYAFSWTPRRSGTTSLRVLAPSVTGLATGVSGTVRVTAFDTVASLAQDVLTDRRITLANVHESGQRDAATAWANVHDLAAGRAAHRSSYGSAPGGTTGVDLRLLRAMRLLSRSASFTVTEIAGGSHAGRSSHYRGLAMDITVVNGRAVRRGSGYDVAVRACRAAGATEVWSPSYDPYGGHGNHVHCDWR